MQEWLKKIQVMDRRWVFLGMALSILLPLVFPFEQDFNDSKEVLEAYEEIEALPEGSPILVSADFDPSSMPELWPFFTANLHHLFSKNLKPVVVTLWPTAQPLVLPELYKTAELYGKKEGLDFVYLGYKEGKELVIKNIGQNIPQQYPQDYRGVPISDIPLMAGLNQAKDFPLIIGITAGIPGLNEYVFQIQGQYNLNMIGACTAVSGPDYIPFFKSGQIKGLSMGIPGSAQYERMVSHREGVQPFKQMGKSGLNVLSLSHVFIILLILLGNVAYFITSRSEEA